jgi:amino acid transporter
VIAFWIAGYFWKGERPKKAKDIDLNTGRKCWDSAEKLNAFRAERSNKPWYKRAYRFAFAG